MLQLSSYLKDQGQTKSVNLRIAHKNNLLRVYEEDQLRGMIETGPLAVEEVQKGKGGERTELVPEIFEPPVFGVTFIGTSHGFDPKGWQLQDFFTKEQSYNSLNLLLIGRTTGFIIWINGYGVLVDPPIQTNSFLNSKGIHQRYVNKVILTHCHSDHDSGIIEKILEGSPSACTIL